MFYVYILESLVSSKWYYGFTENPEHRLINHNAGLTKSTKAHRPWKCIFIRPFDNREDAQYFEKYLKKSRNREYVAQQFAQFFLKQ